MVETLFLVEFLTIRDTNKCLEVLQLCSHVVVRVQSTQSSRVIKSDNVLLESNPRRQITGAIRKFSGAIITSRNEHSHASN